MTRAAPRAVEDLGKVQGDVGADLPDPTTPILRMGWWRMVKDIVHSSEEGRGFYEEEAHSMLVACPGRSSWPGLFTNRDRPGDAPLCPRLDASSTADRCSSTRIPVHLECTFCRILRAGLRPRDYEERIVH